MLDAILFDLGKAEIRSEGLVVLQKLVEVLKGVDDRTQRLWIWASSIAKIDHGELHIVHAWTLFSETFLIVRADLPHNQFSKILWQEEAIHKKQIESFIRGYKTENLKVHIIKGDADEVIPRIARAERVDLLIMGTVCRTGIVYHF